MKKLYILNILLLVVYLSGCQNNSLAISDDGIIKAIVWEVETVRNELDVNTLDENIDLVDEYYDKLLDDKAHLNVHSRDVNTFYSNYDDKEAYLLEHYPNYQTIFRSYSKNELNQIRVLDLKAYRIENINEIVSLKNLRYLTLTYSKDLDASLFQSFPYIERLTLEGCKLTDIESLKKINKLKDLVLWDVNVEKGRFIHPTVENFVFSGGHVNSSEIELSMPSLKKFTLYQIKNSDVTVVVDTPKVEDAEILDLNLSNIFFVEAKSLKSLDITNCKIEDLDFLEGTKALKKANLSNNRIANLEGITYAKKLESLYLGYNEIIDISPLAELKNLKSLDLESNMIKHITALTELKNLSFLKLKNNDITDFSVINKLDNLTYVSYDE